MTTEDRDKEAEEILMQDIFHFRVSKQVDIFHGKLKKWS